MLLSAVSTEHTKGVEEAKRGLGTKFILKGMELSGDFASLGRGKSGDSAN